jgi:hypothetical protein
VKRTYGTWWNSQCSTIKLPKASLFNFISKDYIELKYSSPVFIDSIAIYETYHPGSIVSIYAFDQINKKWINVWSIFDSGQFKCNTHAKNRQLPPKASRRFCPQLTRKSVYSE